MLHEYVLGFTYKHKIIVDIVREGKPKNGQKVTTLAPCNSKAIQLQMPQIVVF